MKLVTFGIDDQRNLIVQFPVFVHPQGQQHLILYNWKQSQFQLLTRMNSTIIHTSTDREALHSIEFRNIYLSKNTRTGSM